jgi:hypothetical protein
MQERGWSTADLFFLQDATRRGMSEQEVAGFLGKSVDEVRAKVIELSVRPDGERGG